MGNLKITDGDIEQLAASAAREAFEAAGEGNQRDEWEGDIMPDDRMAGASASQWKVYAEAFRHAYACLGQSLIEVFDDYGQFAGSVRAFQCNSDGCAALYAHARSTRAHVHSSETLADDEEVTLVCSDDRQFVGFLRGHKPGGTHTTVEGLRTAYDWLDDALGRVIHYRTEDGVYGYEPGDTLVDEYGNRRRAVATGKGVELEPA